MLSQGLRALFPITVPPERRTIIFLSIYLDESGTHEGSPHTVVGGFMGSRRRWIGFEREWRKALDSWGLEFFHMSDFENYYGRYSNWTDKEHRSRLNHLLDLISAHTMGYIGFGLSIEDYERAFSDRAREKLTPYHILAFRCFHYASRLTDTMIDMFKEVSSDLPDVLTELDLLEFPTSLIYEELGKGGGALQETYQRIASVESIQKSLHIVSLSYQSKRDFGALQAADILAYELWKDVPRALGISQRPKRYPLRRIEEFSKSTSWHHDNEEQLKVMAPSIARLFDRH